MTRTYLTKAAFENSEAANSLQPIGVFPATLLTGSTAMFIDWRTGEIVQVTLA